MAKPKDRILIFRLSADLDSALRAERERTDVPTAAFIRKLITTALAEEPKLGPIDYYPKPCVLVASQPKVEEGTAE